MTDPTTPFGRLVAAVEIVATATGTDPEDWGHPTTPHGEDETVFYVDADDCQRWKVWHAYGHGWVLYRESDVDDHRGTAADLASLEVLARAMVAAYAAMTPDPWTTEWPTEPGRFWFYGWAYGRTHGFDDKLIDPRLESMEVRKSANGLMITRTGQFMYPSEGAVGMFCQAVTPELPDLSGLLKEER